ncbi:MAG: hypothetical protein ABR907_09985 [Terracidiphilus sp.]
MSKIFAPGPSNYEVIDRYSVNLNWNGSPVVLQPNDNARIPQTPVGSVILAWFNQTALNNNGTLSLTSGGSAPQFLEAPARYSQPFILMNNWLGNDLSVTNVSVVTATPIWTALYGPGIPGIVPQKLPPDGTVVQLATLATAQGMALPRWMQLKLTNNTGSLAIFAIIGGPLGAPGTTDGNNGYVIAVNASANTGPGTGVAPPAGYYATTIGNYYTFQFNWGSSTIFVAGMSATTSLGATVALVSL